MKTVILDWATMTATDDISSDSFNEFGEIECYPLTPPELVAERIADAEIVLCNKALITADVIEKCPNIKYIGLFATGYNNIDIPKATGKNITVCNAGNYSTDAVAQQTFAYILEHYSRISQYNNDVRNGKWIESPVFSYFPYRTYELSGKTLSIIGYGNIGKKVAEIGNAFGMNVIISTRTVPQNCPYELVSVDDAFSRADIVTLHCPLTEKTKGIVNIERLKKMKKTALLINTSRGGTVNENDLAYALNNGIIAGAGLDVLDTEPMSPDTPLKDAKNCIITPHTAWSAYETRSRLVETVKENLRSYLRGKPINKIN
jgi:glycerate dehydrogenase